jgi:hypothetical protein
MVKKYHGVAKGRVPGIYLNWSLANEQTDGYPSECHAGFDDLDSCVAFMLSNHHSEESIKVFGQRGGQYTLRDWIRRQSPDDDDNQSQTQSQDVTQDDHIADNADNHIGSSHTQHDSQDTHTVLINSAVLGYSVGYIHQRPKDQIKTVILSHFTKEEIVQAKSLLWGKCSHLNVLDKNVHRVDTATRGAEEPSADDILSGLYKLYTLDKPPTFVVDAADISRLPKYEPGELLEPSMLQRLHTMEAQIQQLHTTLDMNVARCLEVDDKVNNVINKVHSSTYSAVVSQPLVNKVNDQAKQAPLTVNLPPLKSRKSDTRNIPVPVSTPLAISPVHTTAITPPLTPSVPSTENDVRSRVNPRHSRTPRSVDVDPISADGDSFQLSRYTRKKMDRANNHKVVKGVATSSGPLKGAQIRTLNRDLFVYRVDKSVDISVLEQHVVDKGFTVLGINCVSHDDAKYKSFQLSVPISEYAGLFDGDIWPEGICVRRFRPRQKPEHM